MKIIIKDEYVININGMRPNTATSRSFAFAFAFASTTFSITFRLQQIQQRVPGITLVLFRRMFV